MSITLQPPINVPEVDPERTDAPVSITLQPPINVPEVDPEGFEAYRQRLTNVHPPERESHRVLHPRGAPIHAAGGLSTAFRHSGWRADRQRVYEALADTIAKPARLDSFATCGQAAYVVSHRVDPGRFKVVGSACHDRFCNPCARERSNLIATNVLKHVDGKQLRFLTLTLKSKNDALGDLLDLLYDSFAKLRRRTLWKHSVTGGVAMLEIKWCEATQRWHPHFHILCTGRYIPQDGIRKAWFAITKTSYIVNIRMVNSAEHATKYVTKYATKPLDGTYTRRPDQLREAIVAIHGRKLCLTFGTWRGITLTERPDDGAWDYVDSLRNLICRAAHGDDVAVKILTDLSDQNLSLLYERAPRPDEPHELVVQEPNHHQMFLPWS